MERRLLLLICVTVLVDTMLYAALAPLLPELEREFGLSKSGSGLLVAAYPLGTLLGALPGGWLAARRGPRTAVVAGMIVMTVAGAGFALASSAVLLDLARFVQGLGGALTWTAGLAWLGVAVAPERRGEAIGFAIGAAVFGAQFGPVVGVIADAAGRGPTFLVVAALGIGLALWAASEPRPVARGDTSVSPRVLARDPRFRWAVWITFAAALAFGVAEVLVPLRLDVLGASALGIGTAFFVSALGEALMNPLVGRLADRRGANVIVQVAALLAAVTVVLLAAPTDPIVLGALVVAFCIAAGALMTPSAQLVSHRAEEIGVDQGWAFALNNIGWSAAVALGAGAGGALGQAVGDWLPYALCAALLAATGAVAFGAGRRAPAASAPPATFPT